MGYTFASSYHTTNLDYHVMKYNKKINLHTFRESKMWSGNLHGRNFTWSTSKRVQLYLSRSTFCWVQSLSVEHCEVPGETLRDCSAHVIASVSPASRMMTWIWKKWMVYWVVLSDGWEQYIYKRLFAASGLMGWLLVCFVVLIETTILCSDFAEHQTNISTFSGTQYFTSI